MGKLYLCDMAEKMLVSLDFIIVETGIFQINSVAQLPSLHTAGITRYITGKFVNSNPMEDTA